MYVCMHSYSYVLHVYVKLMNDKTKRSEREKNYNY